MTGPPSQRQSKPSGVFLVYAGLDDLAMLVTTEHDAMDGCWRGLGDRWLPVCGMRGTVVPTPSLNGIEIGDAVGMRARDGKREAGCREGCCT